MSPVASRRFGRLLPRLAVLLAAGATCFTAKPGPPPPGLLWVPAGARNVERRDDIDGSGDVIYNVAVDPGYDAYTVAHPDDPPPPVSRQWTGEWADAAGNVVQYSVRAYGRHGHVYAAYVPAAVVAEVQAKLAADASAPPMDSPPGTRRY